MIHLVVVKLSLLAFSYVSCRNGTWHKIRVRTNVCSAFVKFNSINNKTRTQFHMFLNRYIFFFAWPNLTNKPCFFFFFDLLFLFWLSSSIRKCKYFMQILENFIITNDSYPTGVSANGRKWTLKSENIFWSGTINELTFDFLMSSPTLASKCCWKHILLCFLINTEIFRMLQFNADYRAIEDRRELITQSAFIELFLFLSL